MTFREYTRTLDFLVTIDLSESERLAAAREAGHRAGHRGRAYPVSEYLYDRLEAAFYGEPD